MKWPVALTASLLFAGQLVSAGLTRDIAHGIRRDDATDRMMRRRAALIADGVPLERRAAVAGSATVNIEPQILAACQSTLSMIPANTTNESGMAVCYNIPTIDSTTGAFQADMRLYRIADATGQFAGLSADGVQVGLSYSGASVQPVNASSIFKREVYSLISWPTTKRGGEGLYNRAMMAPTLTQSYAFIGQINKAAMTSNMSDAQLQALVLPTVTLTAITIQKVAAFNTTLNSTQAAFVVGAFSGKSAITSATSNTALTSSTLFILPGTKILIFPIGAIITGTWVFVGFSVIMYGTLGRIQFRDQYRRQSARQKAAHIARI